MKLHLVKSQALYTPMVPERIVARPDNPGSVCLDLPSTDEERVGESPICFVRFCYPLRPLCRIGLIDAQSAQ
jgi:hypothetical protein